MNRLIVCVVSFLCCAVYGAAQISDSFSDDVMAINYDDGSGIELNDGTGKAEHYDVAMFLDHDCLAGKSLVGVRIPFSSLEDISGLRVWAASSLALNDEKKPVCDLLELSAQMTPDFTDVLFENPVEITDGGIFVGYSFDVDKINSNNLKPVCLTSVVSQNGYFIHTSRTSKYKNWTNANEFADTGSLRMQAMISGMDANAASIQLYPKIDVQFGNLAYAPARLFCHGYNGVSSLEYVYSINGVMHQGSFILETPIPPVFNKFEDIEIPLCEISDVGQLPFSIELVKVNGAENTDPDRKSEATLNVFDFVPVHRPLFEEYTGTWCGNCPRGIAGIETMKERYPDDFICISYHNSDAMEVTTSFPSEIRGFPDSWISRKKNTDPFFGDKNDGLFHLDEEWEEIRKEPVTIAVEAEAFWSDDVQASIDVIVSLMSQVHYSKDDLAIGCALVADDLSGNSSKWLQHNYYAGKSESCAPELKWIAELPSIIKDFHFNDVLILGRNLDGAEANLLSPVEPMSRYEVSFDFPLDEAVSTSGENLVQDKSKLRIVAFVVDRNSGVIINSNQTGLINPSVVSSLSDVPEILEIDYFDLFGHKADAMQHGIVLKVLKLRNGSTICEKLINM